MLRKMRYLEKDLIADEKELAEHKMLVDLGRNDLGRVSEFGTVQLTKYLQIEKYKHVMHLVSEVEGVLVRRLCSPIDALIVLSSSRNCFRCSKN